LPNIGLKDKPSTIMTGIEQVLLSPEELEEERKLVNKLGLLDDLDDDLDE
jgi:hypothetical protein